MRPLARAERCARHRRRASTPSRAFRSITRRAGSQRATPPQLGTLKNAWLRLTPAHERQAGRASLRKATKKCGVSCDEMATAAHAGQAIVVLRAIDVPDGAQLAPAPA